ncbi:MAG TPA: alpha/beta fold hydrolase [Dehalococcoidia bacterium]|nr:alpha/beta fold hydrolase [Dehalococcoidia bacterium]
MPEAAPLRNRVAAAGQLWQDSSDRNNYVITAPDDEFTTKDNRMTKLTTAECEPELYPADVSLAGEWRWVAEWLALLGSPVYGGHDVPRGHGEPVIVVPGFLGSTAQLQPLMNWLQRIGYDAHSPGFEQTIECPDVLLDRLQAQVDAVATASGTRVTIIGHSLGGSLARAAAVRRPASVARVITLGSPLRTFNAHIAVIEAARMLTRVVRSRHEPHIGHRHDATCACELSEALAAPFPAGVERTAIYSRADGVVDWHSCIEGDAAIDIEVAGTHVGLIVNRHVYEAIGRALAGGNVVGSSRAQSQAKAG